MLSTLSQTEIIILATGTFILSSANAFNLVRSTNLSCGKELRYQCTVRREIFEVAMVKFINIKKRRDLTADLKVRIDTGALNDFKK